jgi:hypothetical protein
MSLHVMVHHTARDGGLSTIWQRPKVETMGEAEKLVARALAAARRDGGRDLRIDIFDDLRGASIWRGRVKNFPQR